jgi:glutamate decarboxylase
MWLADRIDDMRDFRLLSRGDQLPVVTFTTASDVRNYDVGDVSHHLSRRGWLLPIYTMPPNRDDLTVARIVCRSDLSDVLARRLITDLTAALPQLRSQPERIGETCALNRT